MNMLDIYIKQSPERGEAIKALPGNPRLILWAIHYDPRLEILVDQGFGEAAMAHLGEGCSLRPLTRGDLVTWWLA